MSVKIRALGVEATVDDRRWTGDARLIDLARRISDGAELRGYEPDYDLFLAREVLDLLGGEVIEYVPPEPDVSGRVY